MLQITSSTAKSEAEHLREVPREDGEGNLAWLARVLADDAVTAPARSDDAGEGPPTLLLLLGGRTVMSFRARVAQSHVRHDLTPSHWSHVALVGGVAEDLGATALHEVSLEPAHGFGFPTPGNALQVGHLASYDDARRYPNIALLRVPVPRRAWAQAPAEGEVSVLEQFGLQRSVLDATALLLEWLAYTWGVAGTTNPLLAGQGLPSAALASMVLSAVRYDVTPGLESRASCPEAIWQAARWWHRFYRDQELEPIRGVWVVDHRLADYDDDERG
jgi:hypothetical protein